MADHESHEKTANDVGCWDCAQSATERVEEMFVDRVQRQRIERGERPALRTVFQKQHGVASGTFEPRPDLPDDLRVGVFSHGRLPCWVRFSSDTPPTKPDLGSTLGIGIKLFDVPGPKLLGEGDTADFIMQNYHVFFVDNAEEFCEFTTAGVIDQDYPEYLRHHPRTKFILDAMTKPEASCLTAQYWAILPFAFGRDDAGQRRYVKYMLEPVDQPKGEPFDNLDYLALDLASRLRQREARFHFKIQFRTNPETMPLDQATVAWDSEWIHIADLVLPRQNIDQRGQAEYGQNLAFNIWRTPPEQEPQGSIAQMRKVVYQGSADQRRLANGVTLTEPARPAPPSSELPTGKAPEKAPEKAIEKATEKATEKPERCIDRCIVTAAIYPPIGVCRVGNSKHEFFIGPEVPHPLPEEPGFYRDAKGKLKRQAARFRIYGLNALGEAVKELDADNAEIEWSVHIANQKSAWYEFQLALDIPEAADAPPSLLRNSTVSDRDSLIIDPGVRKISGKEQHGHKYRFDTGEFIGQKVYLGEVRTDEAGRLIVLGGHGHAASVTGAPAVTFANNDGWYDDISDGPVKAKVVYQGVALKVAPAWVITAPPNYAPQQKSVRTMWDLMRDVAVTDGKLPKPGLPTFEGDIQPIFERMHNLQWVNQGFAAAFGFAGPFNYTTPEWQERLRSHDPANLEMRRTLVNNMRHYDVDSWSPVPWPWIYGDAMSVPAAHTPRQNSQLSDLQLEFLHQWMLGNFVTADQPEARVHGLDQVPVIEQPDTLTRAAMEFCLADAFHPGTEMTWPMRMAGMYADAYRLKHRKRKNPEPPYGAQIDSSVLDLPDGPINGGQTPGSITRWMAVPWQTDTASCRSGYDAKYDPYLPTFWPARVPNQVMSQDAYKIVMDESREPSERIQAFANRADWLEPLDLDKSYTHQINQMIHHFDRMSVVEVRPGLPDEPDFPDVMQVADAPPPKHLDEIASVDAGMADDQASTAVGPMPGALAAQSMAGGSPQDGPADLLTIDKVRRFPNGLRGFKG